MTACASCGQDNAPDAQFCAECGEYLGWSSGAPAAAPAPTPAWFDDDAPPEPPPATAKTDDAVKKPHLRVVK